MLRFTKQFLFGVASRPTHTRGAGLLSPSYNRREVYSRSHRYFFIFIFHFMVYIAGLSSKEPCHLMSRYLDCLVTRDGGGDLGSVGGGLLSALCEEEHVGTWTDAVKKQPLLPRESQPLAKGTHLQADLGGVQGEGEEVSKTGGSAGPQELHSCCGRYF